MTGQASAPPVDTNHDIGTPVIIQVIPRLVSGGAERTTLEMTEAIVGAGWRAIVVSAGGPLVAEIESAGGEHITLPVAAKGPWRVYQNAGRLARIVRTVSAGGPVILHARSRAPAWSALWAARRTGAGFITTYHGAYAARSTIKRRINSVMARGDRVIANSEFTATAVRAHYGRLFADLEARLVTIPRGADLAMFDPARPSARAVADQRERWGIPDATSATQAPFVFLLPGRFSPWKGHRLALDAFAAMDESAGAHLVFMGANPQTGDELERDLRERARANGIGERVHFSGPTSDVTTAYAAADAVLVPSTRPEAFGRVAIEAGAMARPVIVADHGGLTETVLDGQTGIRFAPGNTPALTGAMQGLLTMSAQERAAMGAAAHRHVSENYSLSRMTSRTLEVYKDFLKINGCETNKLALNRKGTTSSAAGQTVSDSEQP